MKELALSVSACALVIAACAAYQPAETTLEDQTPARVTLGESGLTFETSEQETVQQSWPDTSVAAPADDPLEKPVVPPTPDNPHGVDPNEMLSLWDKQGHFREEYWKSLSHDQRVHAVEVLSACGNNGASRARDELDRGSLSEEKLRKEGPSIAGGNYGTWASWYPDTMGQGGGLRFRD